MAISKLRMILLVRHRRKIMMMLDINMINFSILQPKFPVLFFFKFDNFHFNPIFIFLKP